MWTCPDQVNQMASFVNLIIFMESSHNSLRSLLSTLLFSNTLFSISALPWVTQNKHSQAVVGYNSVVSLLSFESRIIFLVVVHF